MLTVTAYYTVLFCSKFFNVVCIRQERIFSFEGGGSRSHYMEASFWRRLWTCRQTEHWM